MYFPTGVKFKVHFLKFKVCFVNIYLANVSSNPHTHDVYLCCCLTAASLQPSRRQSRSELTPKVPAPIPQNPYSGKSR